MNYIITSGKLSHNELENHNVLAIFQFANWLFTRGYLPEHYLGLNSKAWDDSPLSHAAYDQTWPAEITMPHSLTHYPAW